MRVDKWICQRDARLATAGRRMGPGNTRFHRSLRPRKHAVNSSRLSVAVAL